MKTSCGMIQDIETRCIGFNFITYKLADYKGTRKYAKKQSGGETGSVAVGCAVLFGSGFCDAHATEQCP